MAEWKKVIVSGSAAALGSLSVQGAGQTGYITNRSTVAGTKITGSFSGSFKGDGSQLTGLTPGAVTSYTNASNNRIITSVDASTINGESNLTFDGSIFSVTGRAVVSTSLTASAIQATTLPAGTDNTVVVVNSTGNLVTDEIDSRVWGATLVDATGTPANDQIAVFTDADTVEGSAGLTYTGAIFSVTGRGVFSTSLTASAIQATTLPTGTDNTVVVVNAAGNLVTDEIDARVWGSTLVDGAGASTRVAYWSDADTLTSNASFAYDGTLLTVGTSTFGTNVVVAGDLSVLGTTFNVNVANINVEDKFILLNSGSATGDGGIIVQNNAATKGFAFAFDDSADRWGFQGNILLHATGSVLVPDAYVAAVVDVDGGLTNIALHQKNGNIRIDGGEIFIYA